jgi:copper homeostasis protein
MKLEICVDSVESSVNAEAGGADRLELCGALEVGGITPGAGTITSVLNNVSIPVNIMIRPRGSDFLYSDSEFEVMRRDIEFVGEAGAAGIVLGILTADGRIDIERTAYLVEHAKPMSVTFHRAFDMTADAMVALEDIIAAGVDRLLTSGQCNSAFEGAGLIRELVEAARKRIIIMPGAGLNERNIAEMVRITGASEYHMTARKLVESEMEFRRLELGLGHPAMTEDEYVIRLADRERVAAIKNILKKGEG